MRRKRDLMRREKKIELRELKKCKKSKEKWRNNNRKLH